MQRSYTWALAIAAAALQTAVCGCQPVSKQLEIHTSELSCEEANRYVYDALLGMKMTVTGFRVAKPGKPGYVRAESQDGAGGAMSGTVNIVCNGDGVRIHTDEEGFASDKRMTRGVYLSVTGRAGLHKPEPTAAQGHAAGHERTAPSRTAGGESGRAGNRSRDTAAPAPGASSKSSSGGSPGGLVRDSIREKRESGVSVKLVPVNGFASVLDFDADLSRAAILPVKVTIRNGTRRTFEFDPADIVLRKAGTRMRSNPLGPSGAIARLRDANRRELTKEQGKPPTDAMAASQLGDVSTAARKIERARLQPARLRPKDEISGFLYYPLDTYDRARIIMIDVATGETEGFLVEF